MPPRTDHVYHESSAIQIMQVSTPKCRKSPSRNLTILTLDDPNFTSLGLKDRHSNAAPGSSPVFIPFPVSQIVLRLNHVFDNLKTAHDGSLQTRFPFF